MKKIMFCGGGSAGHVTPNIALCHELEDKYQTIYMGTDGIESDICRNEGIKFFRFDAAKFVRGRILINFSLPLRLFKSIKQASEILRREQPDLLFCKGGYVSLPPAIAAHRLGIPVIAHESDLSPGLANKITSKFAKITLTSFPETAKHFKRGLYAGAPIRADVIGKNRIRAMEKFGLDARPTIIIFGGGSGSTVINSCVRKIAPDICAEYNILHICGKGNKADLSIYGYKQIEFTEDMGSVYACADCAVARCGSNSAFELISNKIPTLFIPLQNKRSRGDQAENAAYFQKAGLCNILKQSQLTPQTLKDGIERTIKDKNIKKALSDYNLETGNKRIIAEIERYAGGKATVK